MFCLIPFKSYNNVLNILLSTCPRALHALPVNVDPIPKDITEQFGLLNLHDVSISFKTLHSIDESYLPAI